MTQSRPRVAIIGTGGSIATPGRHALDLVEYADFGRTIDVPELLALVPELDDLADIQAVSFRTLVSSAIAPGDWLDLARRVNDIAATPGLAGLVITHGTATLEETAYFLHLVARTDLPIVLVGAQRPPNGLSTDAALNLVNAVRVATSPAARGLGVLVVMNDTIHSAREVTKTSNYRLETFQSPDSGPLGVVDADGSVAILRLPRRRHAPDTEFFLDALRDLPRVDIAYSYAGADGAAIDAFVAAGAKAIVSAGLPPGRPTPAQRRALVEATRRGVVVIQSSRARGRVLDRERDRTDGFVVGDDLNPQKARVLGMLALAVAQDRAELQRIFHTY